MSIDERQLEKLIGIAGMLGSDHEGERANAARFATILLRRFGMTWRDLFQKAFAAPQPAPKRPPWATPAGGYRPGMNPFQNMGGGMGRPPPGQQSANTDSAYGEAFRQGWQERAAPKSRTARHFDIRTGEMVELWDVITQAARADHLWNNWERAFIATFVNHGPRCQATPAQWTYVLKLKAKLEREAA